MTCDQSILSESMTSEYDSSYGYRSSNVTLLTLKRAASSPGLKTRGKLLNSSSAEKKGEEGALATFVLASHCIPSEEGGNFKFLANHAEP